MKTIEQLAKSFKSKTFDGRDLGRLSEFIPSNMLSEFDMALNEGVSDKEWDKNIIPLTRQNVLKRLESDVSFAFEKALNKRGLSAGMMFCVIMMWNNILEEGLEDWNEDNYAMYGLPLLKATAIKYDFNNPIGDNDGNEEEYSEE